MIFLWIDWIILFREEKPTDIMSINVNLKTKTDVYSKRKLLEKYKNEYKEA